MKHYRSVVKIAVSGWGWRIDPASSFDIKTQTAEPAVEISPQYGSGFIADSSGIVITADHVINPPNVRWKEGEDGKPIRTISIHYIGPLNVLQEALFVPADILYDRGKDASNRSSNIDFALLETVAGGPFPELECKFSELAPGQQVYYLGYPKTGDGFSKRLASKGGKFIQHARSAGVGPATREADFTTGEGISGSPVFDQSDNKAIGYIVQGVTDTWRSSDTKDVTVYKGAFVPLKNIEEFINRKLSCTKPKNVNPNSKLTLDQIIIKTAVQTISGKFQHTTPNLASELRENFSFDSDQLKRILKKSTEIDFSKTYDDDSKLLISALSKPRTYEQLASYLDRGWQPEIIFYVFVRQIEIDRAQYNHIEQSLKRRCLLGSKKRKRQRGGRKNVPFNSELRRSDLANVCAQYRNLRSTLKSLRCDRVRSVIRFTSGNRRVARLLFKNQPRDICEFLRFQNLIRSLYIADWTVEGIRIRTDEVTKVTERHLISQTAQGQLSGDSRPKIEVLYEKKPVWKTYVTTTITDADNRNIRIVFGNDELSEAQGQLRIRSLEETVRFLGDLFFTQLVAYRRYNPRLLIRRGRGVSFMPMVEISRNPSIESTGLQIRLEEDFYDIPEAKEAGLVRHGTWRLVEVIRNGFLELGFR